MTDTLNRGAGAPADEGDLDGTDAEAPGAPDMPETAPVPTPARPPFGALGLAAVASLVAGAIHATAVGSHAGDDAVVRAFVAVTAFQIGWGALALLRPSKGVAIIGALGNAACLGGWILAKSAGIGFIDGFSEAEPVEFADGLAAAMAGLSVLFALASLFGVTIAKKAPKVRAGLVGATAVVLAAFALPGMVEAGQGHGDGAGGHSHGGGEQLVIPEETFDPNNVDLSGLPGVSPEQEARAEALVTDTVEALPQFADTEDAYAQGYRSIRDDVTGVEHYLNYEYIEDDRTLDPNYPESLMYRVDGDERILEAAMFMMPDGTSLDDVPDIGGPMTQWHVHDNLCYTPDPEAPRVAGVYPPDQDCPGDLVRGDLNPMIHVWIVPNVCGPFAALEGIPGGSVPEGEERLCDHSNAEALGPNAPIF